MNQTHRRYTNLCLQILISLSLVVAGYMLHDAFTSDEKNELILTGQVVGSEQENAGTKYTFSVSAFTSPSEISFYWNEELEINSTYTVTFQKHDSLWYTCADVTKTMF